MIREADEMVGVGEGEPITFPSKSDGEPPVRFVPKWSPLAILWWVLGYSAVVGGLLACMHADTSFGPVLGHLLLWGGLLVILAAAILIPIVAMRVFDIWSSAVVGTCILLELIWFASIFVLGDALGPWLAI